MLLVGSKGNQEALQREGGDSIANRFFRVRRRVSNRRPYLCEDLLNIGWKARDVFVDRRGCHFSGSHIGAFVISGKAA